MTVPVYVIHAHCNDSIDMIAAYLNVADAEAHQRDAYELENANPTNTEFFINSTTLAATYEKKS